VEPGQGAPGDLVQGKSLDEARQGQEDEVGRPGREAVAPEDAEHALECIERLGIAERPFDHVRKQGRVVEAEPPVGLAHLPAHVLPVQRGASASPQGRDEVGGHAVEQVALAGDVVVERHRLHAERRANTAHGHGIDALGVGDFNPGFQDQRSRQRLPPLVR